MNFSDIFKSSFLENIASASILDMVISLALAFCIGMFIFLIYNSCTFFLIWWICYYIVKGVFF